MFFSHYLFKVLIWQFVLSFSLGLTMPVSPRMLANQPLASEVAAGQEGGDQTTISSSRSENVKTLPLAAAQKPRRPRRNLQPDFDIKKITAQAAYAMDKETNAPLFFLKENEPRSIGSLTKLMTALVFLDNKPDWEQVMTIEEGDGRQGRLYLVESEKVLVKDLFHISLIGSSNNATMALARSTGLSLQEFVSKMNEKAGKLGLRQTRFVEPTGLDPANQSTAKEMAWLLKAALAEKPIQEAASQKSYSFRLVQGGTPRRIDSTNLLLAEGGCSGEISKICGGKTGFVEEAGYCFGMETEDKNQHQIIVMVLGSQTHLNRFSEAKALANWAFKAYEWPDE